MCGHSAQVKPRTRIMTVGSRTDLALARGPAASLPLSFDGHWKHPSQSWPLLKCMPSVCCGSFTHELNPPCVKLYFLAYLNRG